MTRAPWKTWLGHLWKSDPGETPPSAASTADLQRPARHPREQRERRSARREALYAVVRECMIRAGVLSSAYKFKVLTLDNEGLSHTVLVDVKSDALDHVPGGQAILEQTLQKLANDRLGLEVKSVYWRLVASGLGPNVSRTGADAKDAPAATAPTASSPAPAEPRRVTATGHDEITAEELAALERALDASAGHRRGPARPDFEPTQPLVRPRKPGAHPLGETQYGDVD